MEYKVTQEGQIVIYELSGKIMGGDEVYELCSQIKDIISKKARNLVIDLADVEWTNSCGLGMLVGTHVSAVRAGGRLALANIDSIRKILTTTRLIEIMNVYESREEAMQSFLVAENNDGQ